ncbi:MAG TPA: STAS domain-containing protein [Anaerolineales bacterium]|nr:STAS domain-containing protein [Anaerolineales bacterium]
MEISVSFHQANEPVAVMNIQGNVDASNYVEIVNKAQEIYNHPVRNLILDLSEVPYISSAGLVAIHKIALIYSGGKQEVEQDENRPDFTHHANARKRVKLLNPQPDVDRTLETTGLKLFFKVFHDLDSAVKSF